MKSTIGVFNRFFSLRKAKVMVNASHVVKSTRQHETFKQPYDSTENTQGGNALGEGRNCIVATELRLKLRAESRNRRQISPSARRTASWTRFHGIARSAARDRFPAVFRVAVEEHYVEPSPAGSGCRELHPGGATLSGKTGPSVAGTRASVPVSRLFVHARRYIKITLVAAPERSRPSPPPPETRQPRQGWWLETKPPSLLALNLCLRISRKEDSDGGEIRAIDGRAEKPL